MRQVTSERVRNFELTHAVIEGSPVAGMPTFREQYRFNDAAELANDYI